VTSDSAYLIVIPHTNSVADRGRLYTTKYQTRDVDETALTAVCLVRQIVFFMRDVIYTSRAYAMNLQCQCPSVCLSVCDGVHWRIIANLRFKFRRKFPTHFRRGEGSSQQQHLVLC